MFEGEDLNRFRLLCFKIKCEQISSLQLHQKVVRSVEYLKEWILHGFEIRTGAQEWKTCQASTSGNADHVCILLFYLLLCRTFSPHKQDCITQGEGKDQFFPFFNVPFCRLRWYLEGRSSGRDVFLPSAVSGGCGCIPDQLIATSSLIHPQPAPPAFCTPAVFQWQLGGRHEEVA